MRVTVTEIEIAGLPHEWDTLNRTVSLADGYRLLRKMPCEQPMQKVMPASKPFFIAGYEKAYEKVMCNSTQVVNARGHLLDRRG